MFGPLSFITQKQSTSTTTTVPCPVCDDTFNLSLHLDVFMMHLFEHHDLVIEDMQKIPKLAEYLDYWRGKFRTHELPSIVPSLSVDLPTEGNSTGKKSYFLLSTLLKEDKELRKRLLLEHVIDQQAFERSDETYAQNCLFCRLEFKGLRRDFLEHLSTQHNLQLGNPQNLVFVDELIQVIQEKLDAFCCFYCEKTFPDRSVLKEHMRKKIHKRINPKNRSYDKFYIVNYTGNDDNVEVAVDVGERRNSDSEYSDWTENETLIHCLFCEASETDIAKLCLHMQSSHCFNFPQLTAHLDFYQRVKLVNFIRKQMYFKKCLNCDEEFQCKEALKEHMKHNQCFVLPEVAKFDQPEFYFPTYEDDALLYYLEEVED